MMRATGLALNALFGNSEAPHEEYLLRGLAASRGVVEANGVVGWKLLQRMAKMLRDARGN